MIYYPLIKKTEVTYVKKNHTKKKNLTELCKNIKGVLYI